MKTPTTKVILTSDQRQRLDQARKGLNRSVARCEEELIFNKESMLIRRAQQGVYALSLAEALWLNQKDWTPVEKTFILWHVDNERNKKRNTSISLYDIGIASGLALTTAATHLKGYRHVAAMLAFVTVAKAVSMAIDHVKDRTINEMTRNHINEMSKTNDNIKTAIKCLTPRAAYMR